MGYIPKKITFIFSKGEERSGDMVVPAFIADSNNPKTINTGEEWAKRGEYSGNNLTPQKIEFDNKPFSSVIINGVEERGNGGRAWKTIVHNDFYCDLREDQLIWIIKNKSIAKGECKCDFVFGMAGSQMKMIAVGSPLHKRLIEEGSKRNLKLIKSKDLIPNHIYEMKDGTKRQFIDFVRSFSYSAKRNNYGFGASSEMVIDNITKPAKYQLWFEANFKTEDPLKCDNIWYFKLVKSCSVVKDLGESEHKATYIDIKNKNWIQDSIDLSFRYMVGLSEKIDLESLGIKKGKKL